MKIEDAMNRHGNSPCFTTTKTHRQVGTFDWTNQYGVQFTDRTSACGIVDTDTGNSWRVNRVSEASGGMLCKSCWE